MTAGKAELVELANICNNAPVAPGDIIDDSTLPAMTAKAWIMKDAQGDWVPTSRGVWASKQFV